MSVKIKVLDYVEKEFKTADEFRRILNYPTAPYWHPPRFNMGDVVRFNVSDDEIFYPKNPMLITGIEFDGFKYCYSYVGLSMESKKFHSETEEENKLELVNFE